jgi:glutathione S-transferase
MKLYSMPGACSLATNIALREAAVPFELLTVGRDPNHTATDGKTLSQITSKGYVPALILDNGEVLTENSALLLYVADLKPAANIAPPAGTLERFRVAEWLAYINSELHKSFSPLFAPNATEDMKQAARASLTKRIGWAAGQLGSKSYLLGEQFSVADAYLFVVLGWTAYVGFDLGPWPNLKTYQTRVSARPHVQEALRSEGLLKG